MIDKNEMTQKTRDKGTIFKKYVENQSLNNYHHFFEGKDDLIYYSSKIENFRKKSLNEEVAVYECKSKKILLEIHKKLEKERSFREKEHLFFIDKDFEKKINYSDDIYVTPCYSIENFYAEDSTLKKIFIHILEINSSSSDELRELVEKLLEETIIARDKFLISLLPINAWYSLQINKSTESNYPDLSKFNSITNFTHEEFPQTIKELKEITPNYIEITQEEFEKEKRWLEEDLIGRCRGKYLEHFLEMKISEVFTEVNKKENKYNIRIKNNGWKLNKNTNEFLRYYTSCAKFPDCLREYLAKYLKDDIKERETK